MKYFKYCPYCSSDMIIKSTGETHNKRLVCSRNECNFIKYGNPKPCAGCIIVNDKDEVLLVTRAKDPYKGMFDIPGGFVELEEHPEDCAIREVKEELGIEVQLKDGPFVIILNKTENRKSDTYHYSSEDDQQTLNIYYLAHIVNGKPKISDEVDYFEWMSFHKVSLIMDQIAFMADKDALKTFINQ